MINLYEGAQFSSGFVELNPNSKIPAAIDYAGPGGKIFHLSESASIVMYLAEKHQMLFPRELSQRYEAMNWIFWQMSAQVSSPPGSSAHACRV